jgi:hypothetical protein
MANQYPLMPRRKNCEATRGHYQPIRGPRSPHDRWHSKMAGRRGAWFHAHVNPVSAPLRYQVISGIAPSLGGKVTTNTDWRPLRRRAMIGRMGIRDALREPEPVDIRVPCAASRDKFAASLAAALAERRYSDDRGDDRLLRLRTGSVSGKDARFTVKTYVIRGVRNRYNIDKLVVGSFADTPAGSEFAGIVSVPISRKMRAVLAGWLIFGVVLAGAFGGVGAFNAASLRGSRRRSPGGR